MSGELVESIKQIFPDLEQVERKLNLKIDQIDAQLGYQSRGSSRVIVPTSDYPYNLVRRELLEAGLEGINKIKRGWSLQDKEIEGLEALIDETLPFITIVDGKFQLPEDWNWLIPQQEKIESAFPAVGRIGRRNNREDYWGTGFMVAPNVVMTNWHVIYEHVTEQNGKWSFLPHIKPNIHFCVEYPTVGARSYSCMEVLYRHPQYDLALLRIETQGDKLPTLAIAAQLPVNVSSRVVYVIGHPAEDRRPWANWPAQQRIIGRTRGFKHISLGYTHSVIRYQPDEDLGYPEEEYLSHLVSTLPGNSGSCVMDAETHHVIGLHCAGDNAKRKNYAVPLWKIKEDETLKQYGVNFQS